MRLNRPAFAGGGEEGQEEEEHPVQNRRFKRLRKLRDRLKWRKTDQKEKKRRSQSELVTKESVEDVEAVLDFPKRRSASELSPSPPTVEEDKELEVLHTLLLVISMKLSFTKDTQTLNFFPQTGEW